MAKQAKTRQSSAMAGPTQLLFGLVGQEKPLEILALLFWDSISDQQRAIDLNIYLGRSSKRLQQSVITRSQYGI